MEQIGCLTCLQQKNSYYWSGAAIHAIGEIFTGSYHTIITILENPWWRERYPKEEVLQCETCNTVWHIDYHFPDRPPMIVNAEVIPKEQLPDFFKKLGVRLAETYSQSADQT